MSRHNTILFQQEMIDEILIELYQEMEIKITSYKKTRKNITLPYGFAVGC